jgi:hypothetical protein
MQEKRVIDEAQWFLVNRGDVIRQVDVRFAADGTPFKDISEDEWLVRGHDGYGQVWMANSKEIRSLGRTDTQGLILQIPGMVEIFDEQGELREIEVRYKLTE